MLRLNNLMTRRSLERAECEIAVLEACERTNLRIVQLSGAVGGRENNPDVLWCHGVAYDGRDGIGTCYKMWPGGEIREVTRSLHVIDGRAFYVAGWEGDGTANRRTDGYVLLHPVPVATGQRFVPRRAYVWSATVL